jgi:hypothetical protein
VVSRTECRYCRQWYSDTVVAIIGPCQNGHMHHWKDLLETPFTEQQTARLRELAKAECLPDQYGSRNEGAAEVAAALLQLIGD